MARRGWLSWSLQYPRVLLLTFRSHLHNSNRDLEWVLTALTYPANILFSTGLRYAGPAFVFAVIVLITCVVLNWYLFLLPMLLARYSLPVVLLHSAVAHWLLINIAFHYWKGWTTPAGRPTYVQGANEADLRHDWKWCKKCLQPKPPRTHHCSICKVCTLKMDHHCPWLNNCVGHYNHRYFWMFCVYMCLGVLYVSVTSLPIVLDDYYGSAVPINRYLVDWSPVTLPFGAWFNNFYKSWQAWSRMFIFLLAAGVLLVLGSLTSWHFWIISQGTTSIERHTNQIEAKRLARQRLFFKNPYDFGFNTNWAFLLGLVEGRSWRHMLFPSSHLPIGDGHHWDYSAYLHSSGKGNLKEHTV